MKLFRVVKEWKSRDKDAKPGEITRLEYFIAGKSMPDVFLSLAMDFADENINILAIIEHAPALQILNANEAVKGEGDE